MIKDELKIKIDAALKKIGCNDIEFSNGEMNVAVVKFNCPALISFRAELGNWTYSGIQLNDLGGMQKYKIEFKQKSTI